MLGLLIQKNCKSNISAVLVTREIVHLAVSCTAVICIADRITPVPENTAVEGAQSRSELGRDVTEQTSMKTSALFR